MGKVLLYTMVVIMRAPHDGGEAAGLLLAPVSGRRLSWVLLYMAIACCCRCDGGGSPKLRFCYTQPLPSSSCSGGVPPWSAALARPPPRVLLYTRNDVAPRQRVPEVLLYRCIIAAITPRLRAARRGIAARVPPVSGSRWTNAAAAGCRTPRCSRTRGPCRGGWTRSSPRART